jgi:IS5 family transposase
MIVKQMNGFSYEELAYHLDDSNCYRAFLGLGFADKPMRHKTLQRNIKKIRAETIEENNRTLMRYAAKAGLENGKMVRVDCTVTESNIHDPSDSSLLFDCVRVLSREMMKAKARFGLESVDHTRRAKRRALGILNAKNDEQRKPLYFDLLKTTRDTVGQAERMVPMLEELPGEKLQDVSGILAAQGIALELRHYLSLAESVIAQTERRVLRGEKVPAKEKVVSIFEPHTDIIVKDRRDTLYGHKECLASGVSGLITDLVVLEGNPADATLAVDMVKRQQEIFGRVPRQTSMDGCFASKVNLAELKGLGVKDVAFCKKRGLAITDMVKSTWVYRKLRDFRAGIEGIISFVKRCFGMRRCTWRGFASFKAYSWASVFSANLLILARYSLA